VSTLSGTSAVQISSGTNGRRTSSSTYATH
jgi:hypothetical protein